MSILFERWIFIINPSTRVLRCRLPLSLMTSNLRCVRLYRVAEPDSSKKRPIPYPCRSLSRRWGNFSVRNSRQLGYVARIARNLLRLY